ncbi:MAG: lactonase family protein [Acidothermaceae bacterium]
MSHRTHRRLLKALPVRTAGAIGVATLATFALAPLANASQLSEHGNAGSENSHHAVFVQTNDPAGNAIVSYTRANNGQLTKFASYPTGGNGGSQDGAVVDPLASQGSLTYDAKHRLLFAVNAGSESFTVFKVDGARLQKEQVLNSGGHLPTSISVSHNLVYVLDAGIDGKIAGFEIGRNGQLHAIENSVRSLNLGNPANPNFLKSPAQVAITPDRHEVVVATKSAGTLDVFTLDRKGVPSTMPITTPSAGAVPFGLSFDNLGRLLVAEASGGESSYWVQRDGELTTISSHVANNQAATCWSAIAKGFVYVANSGSNNITGYSENSRGQLSLLNADGVTATTDAGPVDVAASLDGNYLYQLATGAGAIDEFAVNDDGSLTKIGAITGLTPDNGSGYEGIATS